MFLAGFSTPLRSQPLPPRYSPQSRSDVASLQDSSSRGLRSALHSNSDLGNTGLDWNSFAEIFPSPIQALVLFIPFLIMLSRSIWGTFPITFLN